MPRRNNTHRHALIEPLKSCQEKRKFSTEKEAQKAADFQMLTDMHLELRVYQCPECRKWHLTRSTRG